MSRARSAPTGRERGQAVIEFALSAGFLVILTVSMLELTMFVYNYTVLTDAAKEGVRYAVVHGSSGSNPSGPGASEEVTSTIRAFLAASVHDVSTTSVDVDVEYPDGTNDPGNRVRVSVSYPYNPLFLVNWATMTISANSVGRIQF